MSKVTCLAIGDPHFMITNVIDSKALTSKVNKLVEKLQPTFVVILGDLLHTHEKVHVTPLKLVTQFVVSLSRKVQVFVIIGNHDLINHSQFLTNNHPFNSFKKLDNIVICDRVVMRKIGGLKFVFCPYVPPGRFEEALNTLEDHGLNWDDAQCIFAHQEFHGCSFNPVANSIDGDIWPDNYPLVISGHIHNEQFLKENIYYPGSSMQHAFGESPNKIVVYLSFTTSNKFDLQRIDLEMRKKKIVYLDIEKADSFEPKSNEYVKLVLRGRPEQFKVFRSGQTFKNLQKMGLAISFSPQETPHVVRTAQQQRSVLDILRELIITNDKYVQEAFDVLTAYT